MSNCGWHGRLWMERAGDISDYAEHGIYLQDNKFQAFGDRGRTLAQASGQNTIDEFISKGVTMTRTIAFRAVSAWRQVLSALPASLGYSSLSEFLKKFTGDPVCSLAC